MKPISKENKEAFMMLSCLLLLYYLGDRYVNLEYQILWTFCVIGMISLMAYFFIGVKQLKVYVMAISVFLLIRMVFLI